MVSHGHLTSVNEDTIECKIYLTSTNDTLEILCEKLNNTIKSLSAGYIWHRDEPMVYVPICEKEQSGIPTLKCTTCFADNIDDEWFIVYIFFEISRLYDNLIVQLRDNDGDFLLIEAADSLPSWANPDTTENRVFIVNNEVHIIPPHIVDIDTEITIKDALEILRDSLSQTNAPAIYEAVKKRIGNYPERVKENIHRALVELPLDMAALLTIKPTLVSPIVNAYCNHDIIDEKVCKNMATEIKSNEMTTMQVQFTKCLYAMLIHSKPMKHLKVAFFNKDKKATLGLKIACGYKLVMNKLNDDKFSSKQFLNFTKSLSVNGYFKENIEGSKMYKELLEKAKDFFLKMECSVNDHVCQEISQIMDTAQFKELRQGLKDKRVPDIDMQDDNEDWLNIDPNELNEMLNSRYGKPNMLKTDEIITPQKITSKLSNFMIETSDFDGIVQTIDETEGIEFDSNDFVDSLKKMLNMIAPDSKQDLDPSDDDDDYEESFLDDMEANDELDKELKSKLCLNSEDSIEGNDKIMKNLTQSLKEEGVASGPSSNLLKTIGINKTDLLDSDDDEQ